MDIAQEYQEKVKTIEESETYKQLLKDSFGGVMYNVANRDKYDAKEIIEVWDSMTDGQRDAAGGIMKGALNFVKGF